MYYLERWLTLSTLGRACLISILKPARRVGLAYASHCLSQVVKLHLFGFLYKLDQAHRRLCLIQQQGAKPNTN